MPLDAEAPVLYCGGIAGWRRLPDGNVMLEFATPVPAGGSESTQTISLRISVRIVMAPQVVAQTAAFLASAFPMAAEPPLPPASAH